MADCDHIVHRRKKFRKQKSSVSLSYNWNVQKCLVSDQTLENCSQKTILQEFGPLKKTLGKDDLSMPIFPTRMHRREYVPIFIWISCYRECLGRGAESASPPHPRCLYMLLQAIAKRVKLFYIGYASILTVDNSDVEAEAKARQAFFPALASFRSHSVILKVFLYTENIQ